MRHLHPASIILLGFALLIVASTRSGLALLVAASGMSTVALALSRFHFLRILRRSRWLLATMLVLFAWMTPGTAVDWLPGATSEGVQLAAENIARLAVAIAAVAMILGALNLSGLVYGLRALLAPLAAFGGFRDRLAVRLMLTLQEVEAGRAPGAEEAIEPASCVRLEATTFGVADWLVIACCVGLLLFAGFA